MKEKCKVVGGNGCLLNSDRNLSEFDGQPLSSKQIDDMQSLKGF